MADGLGTWIGLTAAGCVMTYLGGRLDMPLRDDALARLDGAMGFDWVAWSGWVSARPAVQALLHIAYMSPLAQTGLCCCALPFMGGARQLSELFWSAFIAISVTAAVSALFPAQGAYVHYGLLDQADWLADLQAVRQPGPVTFVLQEMKGVVSMASYHTVLAVLYTFALRRTGVVGCAAAVLNVAMIASTPSEGSHYLCDVIAGACLGTASIVAVRFGPAGWRKLRAAGAH